MLWNKKRCIQPQQATRDAYLKKTGSYKSPFQLLCNQKYLKLFVSIYYNPLDGKRYSVSRKKPPI